jgi:hypothetical protein
MAFVVFVPRPSSMPGTSGDIIYLKPGVREGTYVPDKERLNPAVFTSRGYLLLDQQHTPTFP